MELDKTKKIEDADVTEDNEEKDPKPEESSQSAETKTEEPEKTTEESKPTEDPWVTADPDQAEEELKKQAGQRSEFTMDDHGSDEEIDKKVKALTEHEEGDRMSRADLYYMSYFIIDMVDGFASEGFRVLSKEEDASEFAINEANKRRMALNLAAVFDRWQVKLGPGATLLALALMAFGMPAKKAIEMRRKKKRLANTKDALKQKEIKKRNKKYRSAIQEFISNNGPANLKTLKKEALPNMEDKIIRAYCNTLIKGGELKKDDKMSPIEYYLPEQEPNSKKKPDPDKSEENKEEKKD